MYLLRAGSLEAAMREAKVKFGPGVKVVGSKTVKVKDPDGMGVRSCIELELEAVPMPEGKEKPWEGVTVEKIGARAGGRIRRLREQVDRIEKLIASVAEAEEKLRTLEPHNPLARELAAAGVTPASIRQLESSFEDNVPPSRWQDRALAREFIGSYLRCTKAARVGEISGLHAFLGGAGAGKTTMVIKLARALVQEGAEVALVTLAPFHSGEIKRIEQAAQALMMDAMAASNYRELARALHLYADKEIVLVDTPCPFSRREGEAGEVFARLGEAEHVYKHFVFPLTEDPAFLRDQVDLARDLRCDFAALSKVDLSRSTGRVLDLALHGAPTFSLVSLDGSPDGGLALAKPAMLIDLIAPRKPGTVQGGGEDL